MNECGFFTILGLCLMIVAAIFIKGIQEFETNYSRGILSFQVEHELQNAADSALMKAIGNQSTDSQTFNSEKFGTISVKIYHEPEAGSIFIRRFEREYLPNNKTQDTPLNEDNTQDSGNLDSPADETPEYLKGANVWMSVASCDSPFISGKIYRRAFAYILDDSPETIHFMNEL